MLRDVLEDQLALSGALPRTLFALLFRPGHLTNEYIRGRIVSYIAPFRLYLVASVLFFLLFSFIGLAALERAPIDIGEPATAAPTDTAVAGNAAAITTAVDADTAVAAPPLTPEQERLQPWARSIRSNSFPILDRAVQRKIQQVGHLNPRQALSQVLREYVEFVPHLVFVLLPVFALLLKLLYIRRDRYYAEHFVFALHTHAFAFLMFTLMLLLPWAWLDRVLLLWMAVYVWIAMRTVYAQSIARTTIKWWLLGWSYLWLFAIGMVALAIVTLLIT